MSQLPNRIFTFCYENTTKTIKMKPRLDQNKTLEQLKLRFDIPYDKIVIGFLEKTDEGELWNITDFLIGYPKIRSNRFIIITKTIRNAQNVRFIEYSSNCRKEDNIYNLIVLIDIDKIEMLQNLRLFYNPDALYFYQFNKKVSFSLFYKGISYTNSTPIILNDLLYFNQSFSFLINNTDKMYCALDFFINLVSHIFSYRTLEEIISQLFYKKTFLVFLIQTLKYYKEGIVSHAEVIDKTETFVHDQFGFEVEYKYKRRKTCKKELGNVQVRQKSFKVLKSESQNNITQNSNYEQICSTTTKHNERIVVDKIYNSNHDNEIIQKKNKQNDNLEKHHILRNQNSNDNGEQHDKFSQNLKPQIDSNRGKVGSLINDKKDTIQTNIFQENSTKMINSAQIIQEESENESKDMYNIYDTVSVSKHSSDKDKKIANKRTKTADFDNYDVKETPDKTIFKDSINGDDDKKIKESKSNTKSILKPNVLSDQVMLGLEPNLQTESSDIKACKNTNINQNQSNKSRFNNEIEFTPNVDEKYLIKKKAQSLQDNIPNTLVNEIRRRAKTEKESSFKASEKEKQKISEELSKTEALILDNFNKYESILIEAIYQLDLNDLQKKITWQMYYNKNDHLRFALNYFKRYKSLQLLKNLINYYLEKVGPYKQEKLQDEFPHKNISLENCRYFLNTLVIEKYISIRTKNIIISYIIQGSLIVLSTFELYIKINDLHDFLENLQIIENITLCNFSDKYVNLKSAFIFKTKDIIYLDELQPKILDIIKNDFSSSDIDIIIKLCYQNRLFILKKYNQYFNDFNMKKLISSLRQAINEKKVQEKQTDPEKIYNSNFIKLFKDRKNKINLLDKYIAKSEDKLNKEFLIGKILENDIVFSGIFEYCQLISDEADSLENIELYFKLSFTERKYKKINEVIEKAELTESQIRFLQDTIKSENEPFLMAAIKLFEQNHKEDQFIEQIKIILNQKNVV